MKIRILTATTETSSNSYHLTEEALKQLADTKGHQPVTWNFDSRQILGKVLDKDVTTAGLIVTVEVKDKVLDLILGNKIYLIPAIIAVGENHNLVEIAFTLNPVDTNLPHIETHHILD